jgi:hypothetical protein
VDVYRDKANAVLEGRFDVFALQGAALGFPPPWNRDPKSGRTAPKRFGKLIDYRDERLVGDIKYLWEPNRHLQLVTLAQAWHVTGEQRYAMGCRQLLDAWFEQCPYPFGINWTSSLELAIRLVNWAVAWHLLGAESSGLFDGECGADFRERWLRSIYQHCHFVAGHFSRFSSANNHLLGEYMGLLVGALTWPLWPESSRWREIAARGFEHEALLQNTADGVNREQAIYYQHEVMDMMLICALFGRTNGVTFGSSFWDRLERMMEFLAAVMDRAGNVPMIGDADDALIVNFVPGRRLNPYRSLLTTGAVLLQRPDLATGIGRCDDKTRWLLGDAAADSLRSPGKTATERMRRRVFPEGGYYVMGARFGGEDEVLAILDCGPLGYLSIAAHGHADALSFTLSAGGMPLLVDPGTFAYHTQKKWRDYFRSTFAHNCLTVDGKDQSTIGGNFLWLSQAESISSLALLDGDVQCFEGEHHGYRRLTDPVTHRRRIAFDATTNAFRVEDSLECKGAHEATLCWHFSEHCSVKLEGNSLRAVAGRARLALEMESCTAPPRLLRGQEDPLAGWLSRSFDVKSPIFTAAWSLSVQGPTQFVTIIRLAFE